MVLKQNFLIQYDMDGGERDNSRRVRDGKVNIDRGTD